MKTETVIKLSVSKHDGAKGFIAYYYLEVKWVEQNASRNV